MFRKNWVYFCGNCNRFVLQKYNNNNGRYYCCLCRTIDPWLIGREAYKKDIETTILCC